MIRHCYHNNGFSNYLIKLKADSAPEKMIQNLTFLVWKSGGGASLCHALCT